MNLGTCDFCNATENYYINDTNLDCELCTLIQCLNCTSLTTCVECNETAQYFLNVTSAQCQPCPIPFCLTCSSFDTCSLCNSTAGYDLNETDWQCYHCQPNYFINMTTLKCAECSLFISDCLTCASEIQCSVCDYNNSFYVVEVGQEPPYNASLLGTCDSCNSTENYYINDTNLRCELCTLTQCLNCSNLETCVECNETAQYFLNLTSSQCQPCPIPYCLTCSSFDTCSSCNSTAGYELNETDWQCYHCQPNYFINMTTLKCAECSLFISDCLTCASDVQCSVCDSNNSYYVITAGQDPPYDPLDIGTCDFCNSTQNYYINDTNLDCELCTLT